MKFIKKLFYTFKNDIDTSKKIIGGRKISAPVSIRTNIKKFKIDIRSDVTVDCFNNDMLNHGSFNAEWLDYYKKNSERVILYIHGGAYFFGSRRTHRSITWRLSKYAHARVLAIDYRLAPKYNFPAPIIDIISAYLYLIDPKDSSRPKYDPKQISFVGDSV
jgi:acetyl esterase/lipase